MQIKLLIILPTCYMYFVPLLEIKFFKVPGNYIPQRNRHKQTLKLESIKMKKLQELHH